VDLAKEHLTTTPVGWALDLGCGSGLSTAPLCDIARFVIGVEPASGMLPFAAGMVPAGRFVAGTAEHLPIASDSIDLLTAAGSLNFTDIEPALSEIRRVLSPQGEAVIYDFGFGREFGDSPALAEWAARFYERYPVPPARRIDPETLPLAAHGLQLRKHQPFTIPLELTAAFYLEYALTETCVSAAVARGVPESDIRQWCASTITDVFGGHTRTVLFRGYFSILTQM
jgi:SAM-dependent methyltransferase